MDESQRRENSEHLQLAQLRCCFQRPMGLGGEHGGQPGILGSREAGRFKGVRREVVWA